ncbi:DUF397 domain-containing protein [Streptomyces sp. NPDC049954]|uniref:DUF397 domain-containing protein n=1 Tax=Streptomyces sp. NPDC049954 TaxID=3155779 RepID=UPI00341B51EE
MTTEAPHWFKSSYSDNGGQCVEIATNLAIPHGLVPVRDSKQAHGPVLSLPTEAFTSLLAGIKSGAYGSAR